MFGFQIWPDDSLRDIAIKCIEELTRIDWDIGLGCARANVESAEKELAAWRSMTLEEAEIKVAKSREVYERVAAERSVMPEWVLRLKTEFESKGGQYDPRIRLADAVNAVVKDKEESIQFWKDNPIRAKSASEWLADHIENAEKWLESRREVVRVYEDRQKERAELLATLPPE